MFLQALATDYDGTIAEHGGVSEATIAALEQIKESEIVKARYTQPARAAE